MSKRLFLASCGAFVLAVSALAPAASSAQEAAVDPSVTPRFGTWGFDVSGENRAVKPGDDFFAFANGAYVDKLVIPSDKSSYGNFYALSVLSQARTRKILEDAAASGAAPDTAQGKIGAFYKAFMDQPRIDALGSKPLQPQLAAIRSATTREAQARLMGQAALDYYGSLVRVSINSDEKNPERYAVYLGQSGLGLPDRDYYLDAKFAAKKAAYQDYVAQMLTLGGWTADAGKAKADAQAIVALETAIAQASWSRIERRDPDKTYNPTTLAALEASAPGFPWKTFLVAARLPNTTQLIEAEPNAIAKIAALFASTPVETLQAWQAFHTTDAAAPYLSDPFVQARFQFRSKTLSGQPELQARWKRGADVVDQSMGEAVGEVYVAKYFPPEAKAKMRELIENLRTAFKARIQTLEWMSPATKQEAEKKLAAYTIKIGYPDKFRDYSALSVSADDLYGDVRRAGAFEWLRNVNRLDKPVDKTEWGMTPQEVNAYNNPVWNEVVFPAAILQPPFFDPKGDDAINYGAIVGVIGHEMTHGFDDEGRKYDSTGHLRDWWTPEDAKRFEARADKLGAQYDGYEPLPGSHVQGKLTMGENIADQGGLSLALDAYHASLHGKPAPVIDGLTGDQRVFLGWAQVWRAKMRDDARRQQVVVDPHSPEMYRVNGVVRNIDAWYKAFDVKPGDKLYVAPADRAVVW